MLRWVPCLGSPSPVLRGSPRNRRFRGVFQAGFWSALRTPGSLCSSVGQAALARHSSGAGSMLRRLFRQDHADVQLFELPLVDRARRAEHEVLVALRLWKSDHIADVVGIGDRNHQPVDSCGDASMRWHAVLERVEQMTELGEDPLAIHAEDLEDTLLQMALVDADAAAGDFKSIEHAVVGARPNIVRTLSKQRQVLRPR